jgi:hypothetical protein
MRTALAIVLILPAAALAVPGCGPAAQATYPSYDAVVSRYLPAKAYAGQLMTAAEAPSCSPDDCGCARVWYDSHWTYYCDGRWVYWYHGFWYHYPVFYVYYVDGIPYVHHGGSRYIAKASGHGEGASEGDAAHHAGPPATSEPEGKKIGPTHMTVKSGSTSRTDKPSRKRR